MFFPRKEIVESLRNRYPVGCRVELIHMQDPYVSMAPGTKGTVISVDDTGTIHVAWDNGHSLGVVYGEDSCRRID